MVLVPQVPTSVSGTKQGGNILADQLVKRFPLGPALSPRQPRFSIPEEISVRHKILNPSEKRKAGSCNCTHWTMSILSVLVPINPLWSIFRLLRDPLNTENTICVLLHTFQGGSLALGRIRKGGAAPMVLRIWMLIK